MNLYIWDSVRSATSNYHSEGGIVAIAETIDRAREMVAKECGPNCGALADMPDLVRECSGPEYITVHPDAGCC